jgi:hypothetical protein
MSPEPFFQIGTDKSASRQRFIAIEKGVYEDSAASNEGVALFSTTENSTRPESCVGTDV